MRLTSEKAFYQPILFIIVMTIIVSYFAYLHFLYLDRVTSTFTTLKNLEHRVSLRSRTDFDLVEASGDVVSSDYNTLAGCYLKNAGLENIHKLSVYWASPSTSGLCTVPFNGGATELIELKRNETVALDTSGCSFTTVASNDYFLVHADEKSLQRFV